MEVIDNGFEVFDISLKVIDIASLSFRAPMPDKVPAKDLPSVFGKFICKGLIAVTVFSLTVSDKDTSSNLAIRCPALEVEFLALRAIYVGFKPFYRHRSILIPKSAEAQVEICSRLGYSCLGMKIKALYFLLFFVFFTSSVQAQDQAAISPAWEVGALVGRLLPNQVDGVTEVMSLGGAHLGYRLSPMVYAQGHFHTGNGEDQTWRNLGLSLRMDQPLEDFLVSVYAGGQSTISAGHGTKENTELGAFVGGSLLASTGGPTWLKLDMNFGFGPGTTLFISLGLLLRFG